MPLIMTLSGTWLLVFAYQREYKHFQAALHYQSNKNNFTNQSHTSKKQQLDPVKSSIPSQVKNSHHLTIEDFGRYQVEGVLGKGAMGIVYQGVDPKINRHVAIKTLQLSDDIDSPEFDEAKERFFKEAMHKDIGKRYQSMAEFKLALTSALKRDFKITAN